MVNAGLFKALWEKIREVPENVEVEDRQIDEVVIAVPRRHDKNNGTLGSMVVLNPDPTIWLALPFARKCDASMHTKVYASTKNAMLCRPHPRTKFGDLDF